MIQRYAFAVLASLFFTTVSFAQPANDDCTNAFSIACGETLTGTTTAATSETLDDCGTSVSAPGVWYTFTGTGQQVNLTTCPNNTYDTKLNVFTGPCDGLVCVGGNDDIMQNVLCSSYTFNSLLGEVYHVLVQGYNGATGDFDLALTCVSCGTPQNVGVNVLDVSATIDWTSTNNSAQFTIEYGPAGFAQGSGTVVSGTNGIDGPPVTITGLTNSTDYEFYLTEDCGGGELSDTVGPITFTTLAQPLAVNSLCAGALPMICDSSVTGNTTFGLFSAAPTCGGADVTSKSLWYSFVGTGDDVTLSTCTGTGYDTKISVFTGGCDNLACVVGSDDGPNCAGNTSEVTMHTTVGMHYLVLVHGYQQAQGQFTLSMTCSAPCGPVENDACNGATPVGVQPVGGCETNTGTTQCAFALGVPNPPCDPWGNIVDTWYSFNTGSATNLSLLLAPVTATYVNAAIYTACDMDYVDCFINVTAPTPLNGLPANTDILVRVWNGGGATAGTYTICIEGDLNIGIQEVGARATVALFPMPVHDVLAIQPADGVKLFSVIDAQGRTVMSYANNNARVANMDLSTLTAGNYVLLGDGLFVGRVVKE